MDFPTQPTRLGDLEIDWGRLVLVRGGTPVKLTPKAAAVLWLLIGRRNETVSRKEILDTVWPGTFSSDEVLTQVIAELRRAFDEPAKEPRCIATVPKLGYRWIGPDADTTANPPIEPAAPSSARTPVATGAALVAVALALFVIFNSRDDAPAPQPALAPPEPVIARPLTSEPGANLDPAYAPDGKRIAYVHTLDGVARLRVRDVGATTYEEIQLGDDGRPSAPAWSPDGIELAYLWIAGERCELRRVTLADTRVQKIADGCPAAIAGSIDWSPDGSFLVFSRADSAENAPLGGRSLSIWRVAPDGTALARVSNARRWLVVDGHPRVAPAGREIAFVRDGGGRNRIVRVASDGSGEEHELRFDRWPYRVAWHGASLVVAAHGATPAELWHIAADGANPIAVPRSGGPGIDVSSDGTLVFEQTTVDDNIWSVALAADAKPQRITSGTRSELCPRISPDGATLAYLTDDAGTLEVTLHDLASGARKRISDFAPRSPVDLRWSPDGRYIAIVVGSDTGKHLGILDASGAALPIPDAVAAWPITQAEWTHDMQHLLIGVERDGRRELHRVRFPALDGDEIVVDFSVGAFVSAFDAPVIHFNRAREDALETLGVRYFVQPARITLSARPADQWVVRDGVLAQLVHTERGAPALLTWGTQGAVPRELSVRPPEPPLGRHLDVGHGRLWYTSRDLGNVDLVALPLPALRH